MDEESACERAARTERHRADFRAGCLRLAHFAIGAHGAAAVVDLARHYEAFVAGKKYDPDKWGAAELRQRCLEQVLGVHGEPNDVRAVLADALAYVNYCVNRTENLAPAAGKSRGSKRPRPQPSAKRRSR